MSWISVEDRWPGRAQAVARLIAPGSSVLDIGAGAGGLAAWLPAGCTYTGIDYPDVDINRGKWPEGRWDVVTLLGVLEYARYPGAVLRHLHELAPVAFLTYAHSRTHRDPRWNDLTPEMIEQLAAKAGYRAEQVGTWSTPLVRSQAIWRLD